MTPETVAESCRELGASWAAQRAERQQRRQLDRTDFAAIAATGFLRLSVPAANGGLWTGVGTMRHIGAALRGLAAGDSSVALVASMHPAVLAIVGWLETSTAPPAEFAAAWEAQRAMAFQSALDGHFWGTVTSEPGSGGDLAKTIATATPDAEGGPLAYRVTGAKHFGSGSGICSFMITTAVADGEPEPDWFFMDMRAQPFDGTAGARITAPWDGAGMQATQSHAMQLDAIAATRAAWPGLAAKSAAVSHIGGAVLFAAVISGIVATAMETARPRIVPRIAQLRPYDQVEWTRAEMDAWLIDQAYEGMLRSIETAGARDSVLGKTVIAELAESCLSRVARVIGGGAYARTSPFSHWYEDVRALGYLRPPWGLAFDQVRASFR